MTPPSRVRRRRLLAVVIVALLPGGCELDPSAKLPLPSETDAPPSVTVPLPRQVAARTRPVERPRVETPEALVGRDGDAITALLGDPVFARRDGPAAIWQYRGAGCALDLFLFRDGPAAAYVVDHAELRPFPSDAPSPDARCFQALLDHTAMGPH